MYPELLSFGKFTVYSYGFCMAMGIVVAILVGLYRGKKRGFHTDTIIDIAIFGIFGGLLGAKLLYLATQLPEIMKEPSSILDMLTGGFVVYGAILGGVLGGYLYCRTKKVNFLKCFDLLVPSLAIAQGIGRIGCFMAGCCYGRETSSIFHVVFTHSRYAPKGVALLPTQPLSSVGDFLIAAVLILYARKERGEGAVAGLYMILYSIGRFLVEFLRNDPRGAVGFLSTSQFICLFILAAGIVFMIRARKKTDTEADAETNVK